MASTNKCTACGAFRSSCLCAQLFDNDNLQDASSGRTCTVCHGPAHGKVACSKVACKGWAFCPARERDVLLASELQGVCASASRVLTVAS